MSFLVWPDLVFSYVLFYYDSVQLSSVILHTLGHSDDMKNPDNLIFIIY